MKSLCLIWGLLVLGAGALGKDIKVAYCVENKIAPMPFEACIFVNTVQQVFEGVMNETAKLNDIFQYDGTRFSFGLLVTEINGLKANDTEKLYWAFQKYEDGVLILLPVGVSTYVPLDGDFIVLSYASYATDASHAANTTDAADTTEAAVATTPMVASPCSSCAKMIRPPPVSIQIICYTFAVAYLIRMQL